MAEDSRFKNDDGIELSEEGIKEVKRLEDKKRRNRNRCSTPNTNFLVSLRWYRTSPKLIFLE